MCLHTKDNRGIIHSAHTITAALNGLKVSMQVLMVPHLAGDCVFQEEKGSQAEARNGSS